MNVADLKKTIDNVNEFYFSGEKNKRINGISLMNNNHEAIIFVNGRGDCYKRYTKFYQEFIMKYDIWTYDHRGQGLSERLSTNNNGHVDSFQSYVKDLALFVNIVSKSNNYKKINIIGYSMGGLISSVYAKENEVSKLLLVNPMFYINQSKLTLFFGYYSSLLLSYIGFSTSLGFKQTVFKLEPFCGNKMTTDRNMYEWSSNLYRLNPSYTINGATNKWIYEALRQLKKHHQCKIRYKGDVLFILSGNDAIININKTEEYIKCRGNIMVMVDEAKHQLFFEQRKHRDNLNDTILDFLANKTIG